jgi:hypothetical protein
LPDLPSPAQHAAIHLDSVWLALRKKTVART